MATAARSYSRRDTFSLVACVVLSLIAQGLPARMRDPLASGMRRTIVAPLVQLQSDAETWRRMWRTREETTMARDSVVLRSMALEAVQTENERLRRLLGLGRALEWGFVTAEVLHGRGASGGSEEYAVVLSAGSTAGVQPFSAIVAPEGLVGMVRTVDPNMSIGILWAHPDFRVSAMAQDGSAFGIVAAHLGNEPERFLIEMRGVPFRSTLKPGTQIVSSGLGGVFPRGIPVGTVMSEVKTSEVWARIYLLRPVVLPSDVGSVMVIQPARSATGVGDVWATGIGADSMVRGIVAAGDSLAPPRRQAPSPRRAQAQAPVRRPPVSAAAPAVRAESVSVARPDTAQGPPPPPPP